MSDSDDGNAVLSGGAHIVLSPDPSILTRDLIRDEITGLRELLHAELHGQNSALQARLDAMDEAIRVAKADLVRVPTEVDKRVGGLDAVIAERIGTINEKFHAVEQQFQERDVRVREAALSQTTAVNAALSAQKEAAGEQAKTFGLATDKAEKATGEQIAQQRVLLEATTRNLSDKIETNTKGLSDQIADLKDRLTRFESLGLGHTAATVDIRAWVLAAATVIVAVLTVIGFVLAQH